MCIVLSDRFQMIQLSHISKVYRDGVKRNPVKALRDVSLHVGACEIYGVVGPNGAGKSTLLKILMGLLRPSSGSVRLNGVDPTDSMCRQYVGYLPENPCLYDSLTVVDHFRFIKRVLKIPNGQFEERVQQVLELVGLAHVSSKQIRTFSKGMVQRAALGCALFSKPEVLILDEPMSGLDPLGRKMVLDIIRDYHAQRHTVLFCSHVLSDVERICDRIAIMDRGILALTVTPQQLQATETCGNGETPLETLFMRTVAKEVQR